MSAPFSLQSVIGAIRRRSLYRSHPLLKDGFVCQRMSTGRVLVRHLPGPSYRATEELRELLVSEGFECGIAYPSTIEVTGRRAKEGQ